MLIALAVSAFLFAVSARALAQQEVVVNGFATFTPAGQVQGKPEPAFTVSLQSANVRDALDEFQRMVRHEQWEKAFTALEKISKQETSGFVDRGDGVWVPSSLLVRGLMAQMPSAGKVAYRLFYDSQASQLLNEAAGAAEEERLMQIVADHMISSAGPTAADRLGDLYFEQGKFEQAVGAWRSILSFGADSEIPPAQTLVKLATALSRSKRWTEFADIAETVRERYANDEVTLGGRAIPAVREIERLAADADGAAPVRRAGLPADFVLPSASEPLWRFGFRSTDAFNGGADAAGNPFQLVDVYGRQRANDFLIPSAADGERVYVNVFGVEMAFDLETGKLLWRTGKLHLLNLQQARQGASPERYSIQVRGDRVWSVSRDPQQAARQGPFYLTVREGASGRELFSSQRSLSSWSILGAPYFSSAGDMAFVGAQRNRQGRELSLLVLDADDGKLVRTVKIGNYAVDQNQVYNDAVAQPTMLAVADRLYLDTHAGALASIDPRTGEMDWAVMYDSPTPTTGYNYNYMPPRRNTSGPLAAGGLIFSKGMSAARLLGLAVDGPHLVWNRPVDAAAVLLDVDDERIYLGGEELTAYDLGTQELVWATQLPYSADWSTPLVTQNRMYQFTARGVYEVEKSSGDIVQVFRGDDLVSLGGALHVAAGRLITVSNESITAYALDESLREARAH